MKAVRQLADGFLKIAQRVGSVVLTRARFWDFLFIEM